MYKDKSKQREAAKAAKARYKARQGIPAGIPEQGIPGQGILENCGVCLVPLPPLEQPRRHVGMCINCVTDKYNLKQPHVTQTTDSTAVIDKLRQIATVMQV